MKQCQQCGVLSDDKRLACRNCQASIADEPPLPEPLKGGFTGLHFFGVAYVILAIVLALVYGSWMVLLTAAALGFGLGCLGTLVFWRPASDEPAHGTTSVYLLCLLGLVLSFGAALFGGCSLVFFGGW